MSTLQCPATLLLVAPGAAVDGEVGTTPALRITHVWAAPDAEDEARELAERLRVGTTVLPELPADGVAAWRDALSGLADQTPGETTVVLALDEALRAALPALTRTGLTEDQLAAAGVLELAVDADGWALRLP